MLLSKIVKIKWSNRNKNYYISKGYKFTYDKDEFEVKVEDLSDNNDTMVVVECDKDNCNKTIDTEWRSYLKNIRKNGIFCCKSCLGKDRIKTKLKNGDISFYDWCLEHNRFDILLRWDFELNMCSPSEICYNSKGKNKQGYWFKCPRGIHPSEQHIMSLFIKCKQDAINCDACNSIGQYIVDTYGADKLNYYWDWYENIDEYGDPLNPFTISKCSNKKVYIYCQEYSYHGSYLIRCSDFYNGVKCSHCYTSASNKFNSLDSLGWYIIRKYNWNLLDKIWSDKNKKSPFEYSIGSHKYAYFKCLANKHEDSFKTIQSAIECEFRCSDCVNEMSESLIQAKVRLYLESLNIGIILHENKCTIIPKNPKTKMPLPFDNEIKELKFICEVNGQQHYEICGWHKKLAKKHDTTPKYELYKRQVYDRYKKFIAYKMGYEYLEIPYWDIVNSENYKFLINNKLNSLYKQVI